ncbi:MAG: hypothetical protein ACYC9N_18800 [Thermoanaerobaculia bacterium]
MACVALLPAFAIATSVRKYVLRAPATAPATGMSIGVAPVIPNCRFQSASAHVSPLASSTGVAYAARRPAPLLRIRTVTAPCGATSFIGRTANAPTGSFLSRPITPPFGARKSMSAVVATPDVS